MIYKPSNASPQNDEIDLSEDNIFTCTVNTSGESVYAYKLDILSKDGTESMYSPAQAISTKIPIKNKGTLRIPNVNDSLSANLVNGKDYQWGVRVYNAPIGSTAQPNTLVCDGYIVGSTKSVIWSRIPNTQKNTIEKIKYDRYIQFTNIPVSNMNLGAKPEEGKTLPSEPHTERQKISWFTSELGRDKDIVKIETEEPFTYNYIDGVSYEIYQCQDNHTVNTAYADPNGSVNLSQYLMIYSNLNDANSAKAAVDNPISITVTMAPCMQNAGDTNYSARKIVGYSSDIGEFRVTEAFKVPPANGQYYRVFQYDMVNKTYTPIDDNNIANHRIGGIAITDAYYKVLSHVWNGNTKRLFIQPNINIKTDPTNPNEIVFDNGVRVDIVKQTTTNPSTGKVEDITINKLDNSQWLLEGASIVSSSAPPIIPQSPYSIYTDFMDMMPYNVFYARKKPNLTIQYRNASDLIKVGYYDNGQFYNDIGEEYVPSTIYLYYDLNTNLYYKYNQPNQEYEVIEEEVWHNVVESKDENYGYREVVFRCLWEDSLHNTVIDPQIKSYQYYLYAFDENEQESLIKVSDVYYGLSTEWTFRGLDGTTTSYYGPDTPHHYRVEIHIVDEYDKEYIQSQGFYVYYDTNESAISIGVSLDCCEQGLAVEVNAPTYVTSSNSTKSQITGEPENLRTVTNENLKTSNQEVIIPKGYTLNYNKYASDEPDEIPIDFTKSMNTFIQFQLTEEFIRDIPAPLASMDDLRFESSSPVLEVAHPVGEDQYRLVAPFICYNSIANRNTIYYSDIGLTHEEGILSEDVPLTFVNSVYSKIILNNEEYYVHTISGGTTSTNVEDTIEKISILYSKVIITSTNGTVAPGTYYVLNEGVLTTYPYVDAFTVKLNSFSSYYLSSVSPIVYTKNPYQYYMSIYKTSNIYSEFSRGNPTILNCFTVNGHVQNYIDVIRPGNDGTGESTSSKYMLHQTNTGNYQYEFVEYLGYASSQTDYENKRWVIIGDGYNPYTQKTDTPGIYKIIVSEGTGYKQWAIATDEEFLFLEDTSQLTGASYESLNVPTSAREDEGSGGGLRYEDVDSLSVDLDWMDGGKEEETFLKLLNNTMFSLQLVVDNTTQTETIKSVIETTII